MRTKSSLETRSARYAQARGSRATSLLFVLAGGAVLAILVFLFPLQWIRPPKVALSTEQAVFSPNGDGTLDSAVILYSLSEEATVSVVVLDKAGMVVRTLTAEELQPAGQHSVLWDGRTDRGGVVTDGEYIVRVTAQGAARTATATTPIRVDTEPPIIRLANLPEETKVAQEEIAIEGVTEPGATLRLNDNPQPIPVGDDGSFSLRHHLVEGENRIELTAVDAAGNVASVVRNVTLVLRPPEIIVDNPPDGVWINQKLLSVQGRVSPGTTLLVNGEPVAVDDAGRFNVDVLLEEGDNIVRLEATDEVGNTSVVERYVRVKTQPPAITLSSVPEGLEVHEPSLLVVGQTEPGATVLLNDQQLTVDAQGNFQGVVNLLEGTNLVRVEVTDRAGNSTVTTRRVRYTIGTERPTEAMLRPIALSALAGAAFVLALWILLGGWLGPTSLAFVSEQPLISSNPFGGSDARFRLHLSRSAKVTVRVWNEAEEEVAVLMDRRRWHAGQHVLVWDGRDGRGNPVPNGTYEIEATASTLLTTVTSSLRVIKTDQPITGLLVRREQPARAELGAASQEQPSVEVRSGGEEEQRGGLM